MKKVLEWWRGRKWVYLGQSELVWVEGEDKGKPSGTILHFYAWQNNMKVRKITCSDNTDNCKRRPWWHRDIVPWLEGGDIWKPISRPIAVQGNLVNFYNGKSQP